jgi:hypothetical protein
MKRALVGKTFGIIAWMVRFGLVVLASAYLRWPAAAQDTPTGANRVINQVVDNWIAVAEKQCDRRLYAQAQESLLRVQQYQPYFNERQKRNIEILLEEIEQATSERTRLLQNVDNAGRLIEEGEFIKAKAYLHEAAKSGVLNQEEKNRVKLTLQRVEAKIAEQKRLMADLYKRSRREYKRGNFEKAREGFAVVASSGLYVPSMGKTAEEYLARIEQKPLERRDKSKQKLWPSGTGSESKIDADSGSMAAVVPPEQQTLRMRQANQSVVPGGLGPERFGNEPEQGLGVKSNIKQSYLEAVVRDAQTKVTRHVGKAEFSLAKAVVQNARNTLQEYRADIDEKLYNQHSERLQELSRMIDQQQRRWELRWDTKDSGL